ncbi:MAG: DUF2490 domain-containing protein [Ferruginibacter sp.]
MMKGKKIVFVSLLPVFAYCQQRPSTGAWFSVQLPLQLSNKWQLPNDFNYRTLGNSFKTLQHLHRAGIRYNISHNWSVTAGAAFSFTRTSFSKSNTEFGKEFRWWQELNYKKPVTEKSTVQFRVRTEERSFSATHAKTAYHAFRYRLKPQLQQKIAGKWGLLFADEYMQQYANNTWSFDQNRLIINGTYALDKHSQLQAGYMWLQWPANSAQHILTLTFIKNIVING